MYVNRIQWRVRTKDDGRPDEDSSSAVQYHKAEIKKRQGSDVPRACIFCSSYVCHKDDSGGEGQALSHPR